MVTILMLALAIAMTPYTSSSKAVFQEKQEAIRHHLQEFLSYISMPSQYPTVPLSPMLAVNEILQKESANLGLPLTNTVLAILKCALQKNIAPNPILTIIDYSRPSNEKRLWVFSLKEKKLLFNTYVSHGITSGKLLSKYFSNKNNSKATSIGVYQTEQTYYGRDGLSLRFAGLDNGFNTNAANRYIVMHGGWYVSEAFIKRYGRAGRSWGCPAVPEDLKANIINTIKDNSLFVAYYPDENWVNQSKFLKCNAIYGKQTTQDLHIQAKPVVKEEENREEVLFADVTGSKGREKNEAILVMPADSYEQIFHTQVPLGRMLRRQIANREYIALSKQEFRNIASSTSAFSTSTTSTSASANMSIANKRLSDVQHANWLHEVYFVVPVIKMIRGYYETQMQIVNTGKITHARVNDEAHFTVQTDTNRVLPLKGSKQFIRWLGL